MQAKLIVRFDGMWRNNHDTKCVVTWDDDFLETFPNGRDEFLALVPAGKELTVRAVCQRLQVFEHTVGPFKEGQQGIVNVWGAKETVTLYHPENYPKKEIDYGN